MKKDLKILLFEDNQGDADLIIELLSETKLRNTIIKQAFNLQSALVSLNKDDFSIILLDLGLPDSYGLSSLKKIFEAKPDIPIVVITEQQDFEISKDAIHFGAEDYLVKGKVDKEILTRVILNSIERKNQKRELLIANQQLEAKNQQLAASEQQLRAANQQLIASEHELKKEKNFSEKIIDTASAIIVGLDKDHIIRLFNKGAEDTTGYAKAEVIGKDWFKIFFPEELLNEMNKVWEDSWGNTAHSYINPILTKEGKEIIVSWQATGIYESEDASEHLLLSIGEDISERKKIEKELTKLSKIVETANQYIVLAKMDGKVLYVNKAYLDVSGYKESEVIGSSMFDYTAEEGLKILKEETIPQLLSSGHWQGEMIVKTKDGTKFPADLNCSLIKNTDGEPEYYVAVFNDITERKQAEEALRESETRFKALHNASFGGIAIHDKGLILECNKGLSEMTGYKKDELIGMDGLLLIAEESREMVSENIISAYEKPYRAIGIRKNGEKYPIQLEARQIPYKGKDVRVVEFRDITESKRAEEEIKKRMNELEIFNEATVGRELKIIELKKEINELLAKTGQKPKYEIIV